MANIEKLMIEHYTNGKIKPTIVGNLGSSIIQHNALQRGDVNMSAVRYTGTELTSVLDAPPTKDTKKQCQSHKDYLKENIIRNIMTHLGLKNTYAFMVTKEVAEKYHLEKVSDLKNIKMNYV